MMTDFKPTNQPSGNPREGLGTHNELSSTDENEASSWDDGKGSGDSSQLEKESSSVRPMGGHNGVLLTAGIIIADVVGAGILGMPIAIKDFGWVLGSITVAALLAANLHISLLMWRVRMSYGEVHTYLHLMKLAFRDAPVWQRKAARVAVGVSQYTFIFSLLGLYQLSVGKGLGMLFYNAHICLPIWMLIGCAILWPMAGTSRRMGTWQSLVYVNIATLLGTIFIPLGWMAYKGAEVTRPAGSNVYAFATPDVTRYLNGISTMTFAFTSQFMLIEIVSEMKQPEKLPQSYGLIAAPFMLVSFLIVGLAGYYYIGDSVSGMLLDDLPFGPTLQVAAVCLVTHMLISYLIKGVVLARVMMGKVFPWHMDTCETGKTGVAPWLSWNAVVLSLMALSYLFANLVPFFGDLVDLLGASCTPMSCWIMPIILYCRWYADGAGKTGIKTSRLEWAIMAAEMLLAIVLTVFGTYSALQTISKHWETYGGPFSCHCESLWSTCDCSPGRGGLEDGDSCPLP